MSRAVSLFACALLVVTPLAATSPAVAAGQLSLSEEQVGSLRSLAAAHPDDFAGVTLNPEGHEVRIHVPKSRGQQPARRLLATTPAVTSKGDKAGTPAVLAASVGASDPASRWAVLFIPQRFSLTELERVRQRVDQAEPWIGVARASLTEWYVDTERNRVGVGVTDVTPQLRDAARKTFGQLVELHVASRDRAFTREDDFPPWVGGSRIQPSGCTSGYVVRNVFGGQRGLVTAGHCVTHQQVITNSGETVGTVTFRSRQQNGYDFAMITGQTYEPSVYTGPPNSANGQFVRGGHKVLTNDLVCFDGATTGEVCGARVTQVDVCKRIDDVTTCHLNVARSTTGARLGQGGDSGGPVFRRDAVGLKIAGLIIAGSGDGLTGLFHDVLIPGFPYVGWQLDFVP